MCWQNHAQDKYETPLRKLPVPENFFVICFRLWAHQQPGQTMSQAPDWRRGFNAVGMENGAMTAFENLMTHLFASCQPTLDTRYFACPTLSMDELWLLQCVELAQTEQWQNLHELISRRIGAVSEPLCVIPLLNRVAKTMAFVGLHLSTFNKTTARVANG